MKTLVVVAFLGALVACVASLPVFEHHEEWQMWKTQHGKSYASEREELEKHLVWVSNKEYIERHNANSDVFGFTLAMNHFGDLVSNQL